MDAPLENTRKNTAAIIKVTDHIARRATGAMSTVKTAECQQEVKCENGVCAVTWKPTRPAA